MGYEETDGIGCSYKRCGSELNVVCFYNKDAVTLNPQKLYTEGQITCNDCNDCVDGLCPGKLTALPREHKTCTGANKDLMTDDIRDTILNVHNYYRRLLATGWAKDKQLTYAKPAAAMLALEYDCTAEDTIMNTLKNCDGTKAQIAGANNYEALKKFNLSEEEAVEEILAKWWKALEDTGIPDNKYRDDMEGTALGKYVNMAYDKTTKVGCGVQICKNRGETVIQCGYTQSTPIGDDEDIYTVAPKFACSGCKKENLACSPLGGLCV
ncbi:hypothetical protein Y032_0162g3400 [Ancylostoma ceylanicum]|uniref:SCP domain-containing protein n=2 Tax=Ancylostoma ceylanicum TaxID=53326 RepID=A0A016SXU3_9BILA|nr:hypothetical protein Y032_0162g3400 [Ancylostoma ceylanicum]